MTPYTSQTRHIFPRSWVLNTHFSRPLFPTPLPRSRPPRFLPVLPRTHFVHHGMDAGAKAFRNDGHQRVLLCD